LDHLIENMPLEVAILSPEGKYRYLSSSFLVDDRQRSWFIGRTDFDYCRESGLHTELALRRRAHRMEAVDRCETVYFEERIVVDGRQRRLAWRYVPFEDEDGDVLMVLGFGQDRTELARCRDDLKEARENSARASRLKEALLQNVSHEIRTPLSGIIGTAQMLKSEMDPALREFMDSIEGNGRRLSDTLNNMIDLAGLQAERLDVKPMMLDSVTEVEDVVRACRSEAERRGLFLEFSAGDSEVFVLADREGLGRCVRSLVDNALKFTKDGGVAVDVSQRDDSAYIRVMDTGVGISRSVHHDVFEPFLQEEDGVDRSFEGAGMGLAVAEQFVRMMNGDLRVHSRKGAGASFVMRLPLAIPTLRRPSSSRPHVLVADPRQETHRLIDHLMEDQFAFEFVTELSDVDRFAEDHSFDVVLIDAKLGAGLTPDALLARIRAHPVAASARCVYLDGERRSGRRALCLDRGWDAYVAKPIQKLDLLNALYTTAEAREAAR
ncbi:MAG: ATP-binding protein, partial [Rhodothermales bacterium]